MKFAHPEIETVFDTENGWYNALVVESPTFLVRLLGDIHGQLQGLDGAGVLSIGDRPVPMSKHGALLDTFVPFELNRKPLLTQISAALARAAAAPERFEQTAEVLNAAELWLDALAFAFPCDIVFPGLSPAALIKAASPEIRGDAGTLAERVLDYMELVGEFDRPRLFFTLNMRSFVEDAEMALFAETALAHGYHVLAIESVARPLLPREKRVVIDADLCEIG